MSTPGNEFREAEYLGLGFLAVTSSEILERMLKGEVIDDDDKHVLLRAKNFLNDVSSGAQLVTSGVSSNASAVDTVRKLAYSVEPLKLMQDEIQSADVEVVFKKMAEEIDDALSDTAKVESNSTLTIAKDFFRQLHLFLVSLIEAEQRHISIDIGSDMPLFAHA